jgi:hypothetical protein
MVALRVSPPYEAPEAEQEDTRRTRSYRRDQALALAFSVGTKAVWLTCMVHALRTPHKHKGIWAAYMFALPFLGCTSYIAASAEQRWERRRTSRVLALIDN